MNSIKVTKRDLALKAKQLRKNGFVPGSVFGGSLSDSISLQIDKAAAKKMIASTLVGSRLDIDLDGEIIPVQLKAVDLNPISSDIQNISFQALKAGQKINSVVHIILENTEKVTALLEQMINEIPYSSLPKNMIDVITIDVDGMPVGTTVTVGDISELQSDALTLQIDKDEIVYRIIEKPNVSEETDETSAEE